MHDLNIRFLVQIFGQCIFFGLKWWKIAKKWVLTHPRGFRSWKWGQNALYSKTWILRPDWRGSAFLSFPCQWVDGKLLFLHQGDLLNPLEYLIEEKNSFLWKISNSEVSLGTGGKIRFFFKQSQNEIFSKKIFFFFDEIFKGYQEVALVKE